MIETNFCSGCLLAWFAPGLCWLLLGKLSDLLQAVVSNCSLVLFRQYEHIVLIFFPTYGLESIDADSDAQSHIRTREGLTKRLFLIVFAICTMMFFIGNDG
jgi:hypothetical protein